MSQKIHIKLQYNNEFRRFVIEPEYKFDDLKNKISTILNLSTPFSVRYQDEESEWITIDSDSELLTGIELSQSLLRLQIEDSTPQTSENPNPVQKKRCRKERNDATEQNSEQATELNVDDVPKGRRCNKKWRKDANEQNSDKACDVNDDVPKWKRCKKWRNQNNSDPTTVEQNPDQNTEQVTVNDDCPKWKRFRKCRNDTSEQPTDQNNDCPKWKRYRKGRNDNSGTDGNEMKGCGGRRGYGRGKFRQMENSDSDSIEDKTAEEIKKEMGSLKEEIQLLMQKKKGLWEEMKGLKEQISTLRQNNGAKEEIVKLREQIFEKKKAAQTYQMQIGHSKNRIWKLKGALVVKAD